MDRTKELKRQLEFHRNSVLNTFKSIARCFETYEVAAEIEDTIVFSCSDENESKVAQEVELDGTIVIYQYGKEVGKVQPEECTTEFLLDVLESMEKTLDKLYNENMML